ncbi:MAG: DUF790 family protein [Sedimentisphaerales bacterium]|nr:DUF790 family protein [Sedimentisphaerales bacterium]
MLTSEHAIIEYKAGRVFPDRLTQSRHGHYIGYAERMLSVYRDGIGKERRQLHRRIELIFAEEPDCPPRRIQAFCKLLDDGSVFRADSAGRAARLRLTLFSMAAPLHPLVQQPDRLFEQQETQTKARLAETLGLSWDQIDHALYADVLSFQQLDKFVGYPDPGALLSRYNIAQLQACLYRAESMTVVAEDDLKTILRYAKLARLLHEIERAGPSRYRMVFSGPASVLRQTRRYGVNFARFLPALLACKGWTMSAVLWTPWNTIAKLILADKDGFTSHLPSPQEFDSMLEEQFAAAFGAERNGWRLIREGEILHERQTTFVPDFVFCHEDGTRVHLEIVGFWTPEYLNHRRKILSLFRRHKILLAVPEPSVREGVRIGPNVIVYKTKLLVKPVLEALERARVAAE